MELAQLTVDRLVEAARRVRENAYAPYSGFQVGAAVLAADGRVFSGCNVENASYPLSVCAERNAVAAAVAAGARPVAAVVVTGRPASPPCGACRQVLAEFAWDMPVILAEPDGPALPPVSLSELLPRAFRFERGEDRALAARDGGSTAPSRDGAAGNDSPGSRTP